MAKKASKRAAKGIKLTKAQLNELALATTRGLQEYQSIIESRVPQFSGVTVVSAKSSHEYETIPEGAVVGFFANEGNKTLAALRDAAQKGDVKKVDSLVLRIATASVESGGEIDTKPRGISGVPAYAELRYRTKTISIGVFADKPSSVEMRLYPYNGGKLYDSDFQVVNFKARETVKSLECLLIKRDPLLSDLEIKILREVPRESSETHIGVEAAFAGKILRAVTKATKKIGDAVVDGVKRAVNWVTENKRTVTEILTLVTEIGDCPLIPGGPLGATSVNANSSAADLLAARRQALLSKAEDELGL